jgi:hypothetical protein
MTWCTLKKWQNIKNMKSLIETNRVMHAIIKNDNKYHYNLQDIKISVIKALDSDANQKKKDTINYNVA